MSRILALGLLALAILTIWAGAVVPIVEMREQTVLDARQLERLLAGLRRAAQDRAGLETEAASWRQKRDEQAFVFEGPNVALVAAQIQSIARDVIARGGGELKSTVNLPVAPEAGFQKVGLRLELRASLPGVRQLLLEMETQIPFLFVESIGIRGAERSPQDNGSRDALLSVRLDLYGFMRTAS